VVFLSLGSNMGEREVNLRSAVDMIGDVVRVVRVSSLYETAPVGVTEQPAFLNLALRGESDLEPEELLGALKRVEHEVGRRPTFRWGPRLIDVDILLYGQRVVESALLSIPHREMTRRAFVLVPLAEIAGDTVHPITGLPISTLRDLAPGLESVRRVGALYSE
jgi:2-amino-4-hydroxy-6-hydroxymethyldihydropteridine diphosphokinase